MTKTAMTLMATISPDKGEDEAGPLDVSEGITIPFAWIMRVIPQSKMTDTRLTGLRDDS